MNLLKLSQLRNHLASVPDDEFCYSDFYIDKSQDPPKHLWLDSRPAQGCGTAGCVAGHAMWLWGDEIREKSPEYGTLTDAIGGVLGLNGDQQCFLFILNCGDSCRLDAIARLDWLIDGKDHKRYDLSVEPRKAE